MIKPSKIHNEKIDDTIQLKSIFKTILFRFVWVYSIIIILLGSFTYYIYQKYTDRLEQELLSQEEVFVGSTIQALQKEMHVQLMVLQMSTRSKVLADFMQNENKVNRRGLETLFVNLAITFHRYDQIRLIDTEGIERIRINYQNNTTEVVSPQNLQNKKYRKYFQEGLKLTPGQVYVSSMELNEEHGEIELPHKPVVRFVTPIVNDNGRTVGYMVMNYLATELLENFREQMTLRINGQGMLIDPRGYWISNHDRSNEWGGSLESVTQTFKDLYPNAWSTVNTQSDGVIKTKSGLFRYVSINPFTLNSIGKYKAEKSAALSVTAKSKQQNDWKLIIFLPNETMESRSFFYKPIGRFLIISLFISSAAILLLILILSEQRRRQRRYDRFITNELTDLYENSPCGYHSLDKEGTIIKINQTELNWLGYSREEVLGKSFTEFLTNDSIHIFEDFLIALQQDKKVEGVVLEIRCKDGHTFFVSTSATSILEKGYFSIARTSAFDITDRIKLEQRLDYIAHTDVLTEISNRRHFFIQAKEIFAKQNDISLLMIDIDHFKNVNDQYGHDVGDLVLKFIAKTLQQALPNDAILARLGGEEFAILTGGLNDQEVLALANNICTTIAHTPILITPETNIKITISIGISQKINTTDKIDQLLKRADIALYEAKTSGRNKVVRE
ncbi:diguanylate cyclase [Psychromonas sp. RZ22]|uniref:diguanylate cyclase n=1 Tax=Psychromonas algarum TaxID=2555643 RepID=UPI00106806B1|nr:diguanylate cyclase [Psychromonas sp. RZ22]TEW55164.1 diguanylate cyclase [Psychromonas sp. RZ22]